MNQQNVQDFLDYLIGDSELFAASDVKGREGFKQMNFMELSAEERLLAPSDVENGSPHPVSFPFDEDHLVALEIATIAMLHLRRYWRESDDFMADRTKKDLFHYILSDLDAVIDHMRGYKSAIIALAATVSTSDPAKTLAAANSVKSKAARAAREAKWEEEKAGREVAKVKVGLAMSAILDRVPVEQLAASLGGESDEE